MVGATSSVVAAPRGEICFAAAAASEPDTDRLVEAGIVSRPFDVSDLVNLLIESESKKAA